MHSVGRFLYAICVWLFILISHAAAAEDQLIIIGSEGPIIVEDIPIRIGGPWKRLVALNSLIRIEIAPHHDMPVGAYFVTIVASHVPVHFNVTLGVVPVAGKGELVPAPGDILTKRLHGLYPHPFATFNTTVNLMGVYKLVVFIEDDTDIYVEIVYQLKRAGLAAFQQVAIEPLREELVAKEREITKEEHKRKKDSVRKAFETWAGAERERCKDLGDDEVEAAKARIKEAETEMKAELGRLDAEFKEEYAGLLELQALRESEVKELAQRCVARLTGPWPPGFTEEELEAQKLEIQALAERIRLWDMSHARLRKSFTGQPGELERLGKLLSGEYELEGEGEGANGEPAMGAAANKKKDDIELTYYRRLREYAHSRFRHMHAEQEPAEWHPETEEPERKHKHRHEKEAHNVTVVAASRPFRVLPPTQCNGAPWHKEVKCDDCVSALRFQCAWCDTLDACVLSDGVGPLDRDACPEFHLQQCIVEGSRIMVVVPMVVGGCLLLLVVASCCYCERDIKRRVRRRQKLLRELDHVHSDNYPSYGTIVHRE